MNKSSLVAIIVCSLIAFLIGTQMHGCKGFTGSTQLISSDTVIKWVPRADTLYQAVQLTNTIPYTIWGHDTVFVKHTETISGHDTAWMIKYQAQTDTASYADSIRQKNEFKAIILDTLFNNRIIGRSVSWANISPIEQKTVTNTIMKVSLVKVYAGIDAQVPITDIALSRFGISAGLSFVISDKYMADLGYDIIGQKVNAGLKIKLQFGK